jgi:UDP-N-acetylglucosamine transferase subunit ALG13
MLPFDRLVRAMDEWSAANPGVTVFAQIGESELVPSRLDYRKFITPDEFRQRFQWSDLVVSHVGMGTVITASECGRPLLMLPRRPELKEVTSSHQLDTAHWLDGQPGIYVFESDRELTCALSSNTFGAMTSQIETGTRSGLIGTIRNFIEQ